MQEVLKVASLFLLIGDANVQCYKSPPNTYYATCSRAGAHYVFSAQLLENRTQYILTVDRQCLLASYILEDITSELRELVLNDQYVIERNSIARALTMLINGIA